MKMKANIKMCSAKIYKEYEMSSKHVTQYIKEFLYFGQVLLFCSHIFVKLCLIQPNFIIILSTYLSSSRLLTAYKYTTNLCVIER
jgi:hypothetical protein